MAKKQSVSIPKEQPTAKTLQPLAESSIWGKALLYSLLAVFILMTIMSFWYGISGDEVDMNEYGKAILKFYTSFGHDRMALDMPKEYNRDGMAQYYGGFFDLICAIVNKFSPLNEYTTRHVLNAWAGFLGIFFAAKIAVRAFGKQAGLICVWLMFLSPFFLGHAMNNPKDVPFATGYIVALYCIINLFDHMPKPKVKHYVWAIVSIGAAINVRVAGILLIPYMFVLAALMFVFTDKSKEKVVLKDWVKPLVIVSVAGFFAGCIFWPFALQNPLGNPFDALDAMSNFKVGLLQLFDGTKVAFDDLPQDYLVKSFIITNSYVLLIGIVLMAVFLIAVRKKPAAAIIYFVVFTGVFPLAYVMYKHSNVYHLWRHVLFIFPSLAIAAAGGWYMFNEYLLKKNFKYGMAIVAVLMLEPAFFIISTFPNTITYFNGFAGGIKGAYGNYEMDYYYNSMKQDADWFKKNELPKIKPGDSVIIATNAAHIMVHYFEDSKNVKIKYVRFGQRDESDWDYSVFHIALIPEEEIKAKTWLPESTLFKAEVKGCALSAVVKRPSYDDVKGMDALKRKSVDSALNYFNAYLKVDKNNVEMLQMTAEIYHELGKDDVAGQYQMQAKKLLEGAGE